MFDVNSNVGISSDNGALWEMFDVHIMYICVCIYIYIYIYIYTYICVCVCVDADQDVSALTV